MVMNTLFTVLFDIGLISLLITCSSQQTITLKVNNITDYVEVYAGSSLEVLCSTSTETGLPIVLYSQLHKLKVSHARQLNHFMMTMSHKADNFTLSCRCGPMEATVTVVVLDCDANNLHFMANSDSGSLEVKAGSQIYFTCTADANCGAQKTLVISIGPQVVSSARLPNATHYTETRTFCGQSFTMRCKVMDHGPYRDIPVNVTACDVRPRHEVTTRAVARKTVPSFEDSGSIALGVSLGITSFLVFSLCTICLCCWCSNRRSRRHQEGQARSPPPVSFTSTDHQVTVTTDHIQENRNGHIFHTDTSLQEGLSSASVTDPPDYSSLPPSYDDVVHNYKQIQRAKYSPKNNGIIVTPL
ncbi:uncharacterized protein LOC106070071 [Biomphalaria glabrata]|uniref:Uncharacterized protein LOC106070071 n=1 Tax=Biomphalaria glabrata TaxID=6526 RepID=A0A9U8EFC1_BIOGL|nr:uncharacterized protein LOC106070071 [Biomphalaria glabrata]